MNDLDKRKTYLLRYGIIILIFIMSAFSVLNIYRKLYVLATLEIISVFTGLFLLYISHREEYLKKSIIYFLFLLYGFTLFIFNNQKIDFTTFIWATIVIGNTIYFLKNKYAVTLITIYLIMVYLSIYRMIKLKNIANISTMNISIFIVVYTAFVYYYELTYKEAKNKLLKEIEKRKKTEEELQKKIKEINELSSWISICSSCKKVRLEENNWQQIEDYISEHSNTKFSHGICPECAKKLYPEISSKNHENKKETLKPILNNSKNN